MSINDPLTMKDLDDAFVWLSKQDKRRFVQIPKMSINDPIYVIYYPRRNTYLLIQGVETFYDENRILREWDTADEAKQWCRENLHVEAKYEGLRSILGQ